MADFENSGFESAVDEGVLGEALGWTWDATQSVGEFARFNASAIDQYTRPTEMFEGWWKIPWIYDYADETARLAATGFLESDVGAVAIQRDENSLWLLTGHSPAVWSELTTPFLQWWLEAFEAGTPIEAEFQTLDQDETVEGFTLWDGPVWKDSWSETDAGFRGSIDESGQTDARLVEAENFGEGWGSSIFATSSRWVPSMSGKLVGQALTFPLAVPPGQNLLWIYRDFWDDVVQLEIEPAEYASAVDLASHMQSLWESANPQGTILRWCAEGESLVLCWGGSIGSEQVSLCTLRSGQSSDVRPFIGLDAFGPNGTKSILPMSAKWLKSVPTSFDDEDILDLDDWASVGIVGDYHSDVGGAFARPWGQVVATFDSGMTILESLVFDQWFGESWTSSLTDGLLTFASFDTESGPSAVESFEDSWTDYEF